MCHVQNCTVEFCTGLVHCSRSHPVPDAVSPIPVLVPQWSIPLTSRSGSFHLRSHPAPIASTPSPVPVPQVSLPLPVTLKPGEKTKLKISFKRSKLQDDMCNNGHGHRQLWTKYVVHIMLHKYSDNGKYRPNS